MVDKKISAFMDKLDAMKSVLDDLALNKKNAEESAEDLNAEL